MNEYLYATALGKFKDFMKITLHEKKVPVKIDEDWLISVGYTDTKNDRRFIPILKELGFIDDNGTPTEVYSKYRDREKSKDIMLSALKVAYPDLFSNYENPLTENDENITNFIKTKKNYSESTASLAMRTFKSLAASAGIIEDTDNIVQNRGSHKSEKPNLTNKSNNRRSKQSSKNSETKPTNIDPLSIVINIQLVLPSTTDKEVYSNLFSELRKFISKERENEF